MSDRLYRWDLRASPYLYIAPFFVLFAAFGVFPLLYTAWVSLHDWTLLSDEHPFVGVANYRELFGDPYFWNALGNTLSILVLSTVPQLLFALLLAHLLNRPLRGQTFFRLGLLLPNVTSVVAVAVIFSQLFGRDFGLINAILESLGAGRIDWQNGTASSHVAIATMIIWQWTGYNSLIYLAAMKAVPRDLYESATLDGATGLQQLTRITIPMIRPTIIFTVVVSTIYGLQVFAQPQLFGGGGPTGITGGNDRQFQTLSLYLYEHAFTNGFQFGYASATAWVMFAVIVLGAGLNYLFVRKIRSTS
ncbi:sugar ABC transporter permease [Longispora fulva]|uniref:Cellobiose transport system permease protein n=1 Tax=Longispora fulva TaxID=619741 RepID=A0A8J7GJ11_9ACTN|nr:sugar ABC transporter permease [Longispora fulva]MBG6137393.1 cellobiose transport system permease protein [Longispora fulva]GIG61253.1 sugar ABC transporter permease [Longispora fulva]